MSDPDQDDLLQLSLLDRLLDLHPAQFTTDEITLDLAPDDPTFSTRDSIQRAIRDLARAGLVHVHGEFVVPTRAALRFRELRDDCRS